MGRCVPLWVFLLSLLVGGLFLVVFGWSIQYTINGGDRTGRFGEAAVAIASFPTLTKSVFSDIWIDTIDNDKKIRTPGISANLSEYVEIHSKSNVKVNGLVMRADMEALSRAPGWRFIVGTFNIDGEVKNAALALSPELEIMNIWIFSEDAIDGREPRPPHRKFVHGFDIMNDGSVIFAFDGGISLQRFDQCGSRVWAIGGGFTHAVTLDDNEDFVWTLLGSDAVKVATATGKIAQRITMDDIIEANPSIDILEIRQRDYNDVGGNSRHRLGGWLTDNFHLNDVDPLPAAVAASFDGFEAGDLLVSARSLNLIFVVDPDTLKIKWWRTGATRRQHDPDWGQAGEITIFDNRMSRNYSRIVSIDPTTFNTKVVFDGQKNDFYSRIRGKHQFTAAGNLIVTSAQQGRVFEVNPDGDVVLEIINQKPGSDEFNYVISEAIWLPPDSFNIGKESTCEN